MLKTYIYLNILFIFGLLLYLLGLHFSLNIFNTFYFFFGLFSILIPLLFLISGFQYSSKQEKNVYNLLFIGFLAYGLGNIFWFFDDFFDLKFEYSYLNFLFIFQVLTKHYFLKFLASSNDEFTSSKVFRKIFSLNLLVLLFSSFFGNLVTLDELYFEIYFILESLISILFIGYALKIDLTSHLDLRYFFFGNLVWFLADTLFLFEKFSQIYFAGNISDFVYFLGFYLMISSILFKNVILNPKIEFNLTKNLSYY